MRTKITNMEETNGEVSLAAHKEWTIYVRI